MERVKEGVFRQVRSETGADKPFKKFRGKWEKRNGTIVRQRSGVKVRLFENRGDKCMFE